MRSVRKPYIADIQLHPVGIHIVIQLGRGKHIHRAVHEFFRLELEGDKLDLIVESILQDTSGVPLPHGERPHDFQLVEPVDRLLVSGGGGSGSLALLHSGMCSLYAEFVYSVCP